MFKNVVLSFAVALLSSSVFAAGTRDVRILTYNIKGLPGIAGGYKKARFKEIGKMLLQRRMNGTAPDIVLLQESFIEATKDLRNTSEYPFIIKGPDDENELDENGKSVSKILNAGLYILSEHPLADANKVVFGKGICKTWDCNANKGMQSVSVQISGLPFKLIIANTHMQAASKHDDIRIKQMDIAQRFIEKNIPTGAMFFAGDFNTTTELPSYAYWFIKSGLKSAGEYCLNGHQTDCIIKDGTNRDWVTKLTKDHHFYREGLTASTEGDVQVTITPLTLERNFTELFEGKPLSDHMGYEVLYRISWK